MFPCPRCGNTVAVQKRKWIQYIKAFKRIYVCASCDTPFQTDEKVIEPRKIGRPKKTPALVRG